MEGTQMCRFWQRRTQQIIATDPDARSMGKSDEDSVVATRARSPSTPSII